MELKTSFKKDEQCNVESTIKGVSAKMTRLWETINAILEKNLIILAECEI